MLPFLGVICAAGIVFAAQTPSTESVSTSEVTTDGDNIAVDVKDGLSDDAIAQLGRDYGIENLHDNSPENKDDANIAVGHSDNPEETIAKLRGDSRVEMADFDRRVEMDFVPNDEKYESQWHMKSIGMESAWDRSCGSGVTVAVIDTGVACYEGNGFKKAPDVGNCVPGHNFVAKNDFAADDQMHGTHVAGTIAQATNNTHGVAGIAFCAKIMPVKVLSGSGSGTSADVAEGIRWAADHGAQVINLSLGGSMPEDLGREAVAYAHRKGVTVIAAAGNSGGKIGYPAAYDGAMAISATDSNKRIADFSCRGSKIALGAPGVKVTQETICTNGKDGCFKLYPANGTSMATPHVAGVAALIVSQGITHPDAVESVLRKSAESKSEKDLYGSGILNASSATNRALWGNMLLRLIALAFLGGLLGYMSRKDGTTFAFRKEMIPGILLGGFGLFPLAYVFGGLTFMGPARPFAEALLMHPLGEWDIPFSAGLHKFMPLANALPVVASVGLLGIGRMRHVVVGFALGTAAYLLQNAYSLDTLFVFGSTALRAFALANVAVVLWVAKTALRTK